MLRRLEAEGIPIIREAVAEATGPLDVWEYIALENIPVAPLYFSAGRPVVVRDGALIMVDDTRMRLAPGEVPMQRSVRFRTLGCYPLTGAIASDADTVWKVIGELRRATTWERPARSIERDAVSAMENNQEGHV